MIKIKTHFESANTPFTLEFQSDDGMVLEGHVTHLDRRNFTLVMIYPFPAFFIQMKLSNKKAVHYSEEMIFIHDGKPTALFFEKIFSTLSRTYEKGKIFYSKEEECLEKFRIIKEQKIRFNRAFRTLYSRGKFRRKRLKLLNDLKMNTISQDQFSNELNLIRKHVARSKTRIRNTIKNLELKLLPGGIQINEIEQFRNIKPHGIIVKKKETVNS